MNPANDDGVTSPLYLARVVIGWDAVDRFAPDWTAAVAHTEAMAPDVGPFLAYVGTADHGNNEWRWHPVDCRR